MTNIRPPRVVYDPTSTYISGGAITASIPAWGRGPCYCYEHYHPGDWEEIRASLLRDIALVDRQLEIRRKYQKEVEQ